MRTTKFFWILLIIAVSPLLMAPGDDGCPDCQAATNSTFEFRGSINDITYERTLFVASELRHEPENEQPYALKTEIDFELVANVDAENEARRNLGQILEGVGTSPGLVAINVANQVSNAIEGALLELYDTGAISMSVVDRVHDSVSKEWISSLGIMLSPEESNEVFRAVLAGICEEVPGCTIGAPCTEACVSTSCEVGGVVGTFQCRGDGLECVTTG